MSRYLKKLLDILDTPLPLIYFKSFFFLAAWSSGNVSARQSVYRSRSNPAIVPTYVYVGWKLLKYFKSFSLHFTLHIVLSYTVTWMNGVGSLPNDKYFEKYIHMWSDFFQKTYFHVLMSFLLLIKLHAKENIYFVYV
jgi:hypothetical protein